MLTVYSVLWGDKYDPDYAFTLKRMVEENLSVPHRFFCITNQVLDGIGTLRPFRPEWRGWWQKLQLFGFADGPSLYLDLDVVVTGSLDYLVDYANDSYPLAAPANWAQSGHGGIQSSVLAWNGKYKDPLARFNYQVDSHRLWGDQEFLTELIGDDFIRLPGIYSYKYHCRAEGQPPADSKIIVFHGKPDPHEINEPWVKQSRSTPT